MSLRSEAEALAAKIDDVYDSGYEKGKAEGGTELPEEAFSISGNCSYRFANDGWNWFIEKFGEEIEVNCETTNYMFANSKELKRIPFNIFIKPVNNSSYSNMFQNCSKLEFISDIYIDEEPQVFCPLNGCFYGCFDLKTPPRIINVSVSNVADLFRGCNGIKIPEDFFDTFYLKDNATCSGVFASCYSIRNIPTMFFDLLQNMSIYPMYNNTIYYNGFSGCSTLDKIEEIPVFVREYASNCFSNTFLNTYRVNQVTFRMLNNAPYIVSWRNQVIDLSKSGYSSTDSNIINYNSGISIDKKVADDETYQNLKNDPDWFTTKYQYSRYNHDSAVNTINSLPDTSVYLATAGGTNVIKFKGYSGSATDGGAINTLTEEEIAVATAKGWTVTLV